MSKRDQTEREPSLTEFYQEHRELAEKMQGVERLLKRGDRTQAKTQEQLWSLVELIESHFAHEESGGYMADACMRAPRLATTAEKLLTEHGELLDDAKKLQMLARSGVESAAWWRQIESDFERLKSRMLAHEHAENKLLHEAYNRDIGVTD